MELYVKSRGSGFDSGKESQDYFYWLKCGSNEKKEPSKFYEQQELQKLLEPEEFGLAIARINGRLCLKIARLATLDRYDFSKTQIFNSIVCMSKNESEEAILRGIAAAALEENSKVQAIVDKCVVSDNQSPCGWRVDPTLITELSKLKASTHESAQEECRAGKDGAALRSELSDELNRYSLPSHDGTLVVVTRFVDPANIAKACVWRSLSALHQGRENAWETISNPNRKKPLEIKGSDGAKAMRMFVMSRGQAPEKDYNWIEYAKGGSHRLQPQIWNKLKGLVDVSAPGIILAKMDGHCVLMVAQLESASRRDHVKRVISNSFILIADEKEEQTLRGIAVSALRGELVSLVDPHISSDNNAELGFIVSDKLIEQLSTLRASGNNPPNPERRAGSSNNNFKQALAEELDACALPGKTGPLVVVTKYKDPKVLADAQVWRSLSALHQGKKNAWEIDGTTGKWVSLSSPGSEAKRSDKGPIDISDLLGRNVEVPSTSDGSWFRKVSGIFGGGRSGINSK